MGTYISIGISIAGFVGGMIATVAKLSAQYSKLRENVKFNEERDKEERSKNSVKFAELYNRMSTNEGNVKELNTKVDMLNQTCGRIESKLDKIIGGGAK